MKRLWHGLMTMAVCLGMFAVLGTTGIAMADVTPGTSREEATALPAGELVEVTFTNGNEAYWFTFTPAETGWYTFSSQGDDIDTRGWIYEKDSEEDPYYNDDAGEGCHFWIQEELTEGQLYYLLVQTYDDDTGTCSISVEKTEYDNKLFAECDMSSNSLRVEAGGSLTLHVLAECRQGNIAYQWLDPEGNEIPGETDNEYMAENVTPPETYTCVVTDDYGNVVHVPVTITLENSLSAYAEQEEVDAAENSEVTLKVNAQCDLGTLSYEWQFCNDDDEYETIAGETKATYTFTASKDQEYRVIVRDEYGNDARVYFYVEILGDLKLRKADYIDEAVAGKSISFTVIPVARDLTGITYQWYEQEEDSERQLLAGETSETLTIQAKYGDYTYICVGKQNEVEAECHFYVHGYDFSKAVQIREGETKQITVTDDGIPVFLKFVPEISGNYEIYSSHTENEDPYGQLFDGAEGILLISDDDGKSNLDFSIKCSLTAGKEYYIEASNLDRHAATYSVTVVNTDSAEEQARAKDEKAASDVTSVINNLKAAGNLTLNDKAAVAAARTAYNKLTDAQKKLVSTAVLKKMTDAEAKIAALEKAASDAAAKAKAEAEAKAKAAAVKKVTALKITADSNKIAAGKSVQLRLDVAPADATNKAVTWTSSNTKVATVDANGKVKVLKKTGGKKAVITATAKDGSGKKATFTIQSMKGVVKKIKITGSKTVKAGKKLKLKAKVTATKKANKKLIWTSSNEAWATVKNGKVTIKKAGKGKKVTITAKATDGSGKKAKVKIKIKK